jgi:hypothetical protein
MRAGRHILGLAIAATLAGAAAPASAQWRGDRWDDRGDDAALAIGAGVIGLAAGVALARGDRWDRWDRWDRGGRWDRWDRRWHPRYDGRWGWRGRWDPRFGPPGWGGRWGPGWRAGRWGPGVRCWRERVWDDWRGRWRRVRVCR